jgi:hypothetical protein
MFRRKIKVGANVFIKSENRVGTVTLVRTNPYIPWTSVTSYQIDGAGVYSRDDLKLIKNK